MAFSDPRARLDIPVPAGFATSHRSTIVALREHQTASSTAGSAASNQTDIAVPAGFANFHGVTVETMMWLDNSSVIRNQQHYDDVAMRKYYVDMFRLQAPSVTQRPTAPAKHDARLSSPHQCLWSWS